MIPSGDQAASGPQPTPDDEPQRGDAPRAGDAQGHAAAAPGDKPTLRNQLRHTMATVTPEERHAKSVAAAALLTNTA